MTTKREWAHYHADCGLYVFPAAPGTKGQPIMKEPYLEMTRDHGQIEVWWKQNPEYNICLPGGYELQPGQYLGWLDLDAGKGGFETLDAWDLCGLELPNTRIQISANKGRHYAFTFPFPLKSSVQAIGKGMDIRGFHAYVIGAGSEFENKPYQMFGKASEPVAIAPAPKWLVNMCEPYHRPKKRAVSLKIAVDEKRAEKEALRYLSELEPAVSGTRNDRTYRAANRLKDIGIDELHVVELMEEHFKCEPPLDIRELEQCVNKAFRHGQNAQGSSSPEAAFSVIEGQATSGKGSGSGGPAEPRHPLEMLNEQYAFVTAGGGAMILHDTTDFRGYKTTVPLRYEAWKMRLANQKYSPDGERRVPLSKAWMEWEHRRSFEGIVFEPNASNDRFYNRWQGFKFKPLETAPTPEAEKALEMFKEHIFKNVAQENTEHYLWIMGWFAHMFQKPEEKVRTALVLKGKKGVGKSRITDFMSELVGVHFMSTAHKSRLTGNFNSHLEDKLMLVMEEAFWSGDKQADSILKDLVTGKDHIIERKNVDTYSVRNICRVVISGNENWIVPASEDERRYGVFQLGEGRRNDQEFFGQMSDNMDFSLLIKFFMDFDLSQVNVNKAPNTEALAAQKEESSAPLVKWWKQSLEDGALYGCGGDTWDREVEKSRLRDSFVRFLDDHNIGGRRPNDTQIGKELFKLAPEIKSQRHRADGGSRKRFYQVPSLAASRKAYENFINAEFDWEPEDD